MAKVRVSQTWLEVVAESDGNLQVSQAMAEALGTLDGNLRVTQSMLEVVGVIPGELRVSQAMVEVLGIIAGPNMPHVTASNITGTSADLTGTAFEQGTGSSAVHESTRWIVRNAHTLEIVYDPGESADLTFHEIPTGGLPSGADLIPGAMYKNEDQQWSLFPGSGTEFTTSVTSTEAAVALDFWEGDDNGPTVFISRYITASTPDADYGDWVVEEDVPIPVNTRYILPSVWKVGSELSDVRVKEFQLDRGLVSSGYHPRAYRPVLDDERVIVPAGADMGDQSGTFDIDWAEGNVAAVTLGAAAVMTWSNVLPFGRYWLALKQDTTGGRTVTWPTAAKFASGSTPTLTTAVGAVDLFELVAESASIVHVRTFALDSK